MEKFSKVDLLVDMEMYTPYFTEGMTDSSQRCLDIMRFLIKEKGRQTELEFDRIISEARKDMGPGSVSSAYEALKKRINHCHFMSELVNTRHELPPSLRGKRIPLYNALMEAFYNFHVNIVDAKIFLTASTCMFEPEDLHSRIDPWFSPGSYEPLEGRLNGFYRAEERMLRIVPDTGNPYQRVIASITVSPDDQIDLDYLVRNQDDKLHFTVTLDEQSFSLSQYQVVFMTPREKNIFDGLILELKRSTSSGNFMLKLEGSECSRDFISADEISSKFYYTTLVQNPVLLGGKGFLNLMLDVMNNYGRIIDAASAARHS